MADPTNRERPPVSLAVSDADAHRQADRDRTLWRGWLREIVLCVPDPDNAASYYAALLDGRAGNRSVALGSSTRIVLMQGAPALSSITLDLVAGDSIGALGEPVGGEENVYALADPDGRSFRIRPVSSIEEQSATTVPRLGHLTFETPDPLRAQRFCEQLGFQLSEGLSANFRWLRCNPIHHTLAFSRGPAPALHHIAIEVKGRAALIDVCDRLAAQDYLVQYGPGRHLVGSNLFIYALDRYGIRFEFFCELQRITAHDWQPPVHEALDRSRSINVWGPQPPTDYWKGL